MINIKFCLLLLLVASFLAPVSLMGLPLPMFEGSKLEVEAQVSRALAGKRKALEKGVSRCALVLKEVCEDAGEYAAVAETAECAVEQYQQSSQAYNEGREKEGDSFFEAGNNFLQSAESMVQSGVLENAVAFSQGLTSTIRSSEDISAATALVNTMQGEADLSFKNKEECNGVSTIAPSPIAEKIIIPRIIEPTETDCARWKAREYADTLSNKVTELKRENPENSKVFQRFCGDMYRSQKKPKYNSVAVFALHSARIQMKQAEEEWAHLVGKADKERIADRGDVCSQNQALLNAWKKEDRKAMAAWKEQCKIKREKESVTRMEKDWDANLMRWEARKKADQLLQGVQEVKTNLKKILEIPQQDDESWHQEYDGFDKKVKETQTAAKEAEKKWSLLAGNEESVLTAQRQGKEAITLAQQKLKESDRAVIALKEEIQKQSKKSSETNEEKEERIAREAKHYEMDLLMKSAMELVDGFGIVDIARAGAQAKYRHSDDVATRGEAKILYEEVDRLEKSALKEYAKTAENDALVAARKNIPGAEKAWEARVVRAIADQQTVEAKVGFACDDDWADDHQKIVQRMNLLVESEKTALEAFKKERERLSDIEITYLAKIENEKNLFRAKVASLGCEAKEVDDTAQIAFDKANHSGGIERIFLWNDAKEKALEVVKIFGAIEQAYRQSCDQASLILKNEWVIELEKMEEEKNLWIARAQWSEGNQVAVSAEGALEKASNHPVNIEKISLWSAAKDKALEVVRVWEKTVGVCRERCDQAPEKFKERWRVNLKAVENVKNQWAFRVQHREVNKAGNIAMLAGDKAKDHFVAVEQVPLWEEARQKALDVVRVLGEMGEFCKNECEQVAKEFQDWWITHSKELEYEKAQWIAKAQGYEATKATCIALIAMNKISEATVADKAQQWSEAIEKALETLETWKKTVEVYQEGRDLVPSELKAWWIAHLETVEDLRNSWAARVQWNEASKAVAITAAACDQVINSPVCAEQISLWEEMKEKAKEVVIAWEKARKIYTDGRDQATEKNKDWWESYLAEIENMQTSWAGKVSWYEANKIASLAEIAREQAVAHLGDSEEIFFWRKAQEKAVEVVKAWQETIDIYQASRDHASPTAKEWWEAELVKAENEKTLWERNVIAWGG
ncbi:MAG TPA: hypothetical protein VJK54_10495 [Chthoniobacterales bacterium]|nr:hypothetical protein [Chthoniobacterales bacterium]